MAKKVDVWIFGKHRRIFDKTLPWKVKHGLTDTPLYYIWCGMKQRCYNANNPKYEHYGKKGVRVCDLWHDDFNSFFDWAINNGYEHGLTIDRIDVDGDYCPANCRWVDYKEQNRNFSRNVNITFGGRTMCISAWAEFLNINRATLARRLRKGWSIEKALTTPVDSFYRRNYKK